MKKCTVELDETVYCWLEYISNITGDTIEKIISNSIYHQIEALEDTIIKAFTYNGQQ